jgi:hypothetical protein
MVADEQGKKSLSPDFDDMDIRKILADPNSTKSQALKRALIELVDGEVTAGAGAN